MKYIFILLMAFNASALDFEQQELNGLAHRQFNGDIEFINDNSWRYTSHTNANCTFSNSGDNALKSPCRKVNSSFVEGVTVQDRVTKISFDLTVDDINLFGKMGWNIIYQDWVRINPNDSNGNHPITTVKLIIVDNVLNACTFNNAWQWGYNYPTHDPYDSLHEHQTNTVNGCGMVGAWAVPDKVEIITYDSGRVIFKMNNLVISDYSYQTKSATESHVIQWGQYWNKGFNLENDANDNIELKIENFTRSVATE